MNPIIVFLILVLAAAILILGFCLYRAYGKIWSLEKAGRNLMKERSKQSDQLRLKGIEIDKLKKELDKYSDVEIKVALTALEKKMIFNALDSSQYKARIQDPKTKFFIRLIYRKLKEKIKESIKE